MTGLRDWSAVGEGEGGSVGDGSQDSGWGDWVEPQIEIKNTGLGVDMELSLGNARV